jgi:hypothetical protein
VVNQLYLELVKVKALRPAGSNGTTRIDQIDRPVRFFSGAGDWLRPDVSQIASIAVDVE